LLKKSQVTTLWFIYGECMRSKDFILYMCTQTLYEVSFHSCHMLL
jgi:hypothetical protein